MALVTECCTENVLVFYTYLAQTSHHGALFDQKNAAPWIGRPYIGKILDPPLGKHHWHLEYNFSDVDECFCLPI